MFVKDGDFHQVTKLLEPKEFAILKPLVLLLGWPHCYSCDNALSLLGALWQPKVSCEKHLELLIAMQNNTDGNVCVVFKKT